MAVFNPSIHPVEATCGMIVVHPEAPAEVASVLPTDIAIDPRIIRSYEAALKSFNGQGWDSTAVQCRKTLEGLVKMLLPENKRNGTLAKQLERLPEETNLSLPILQLAEVVKDGGNIGAHFDNEIDTTEDMARQLIKLVEYFILYLHVIPKEVEKLKAELESSEPEATSLS